ncbi:bifunctional phosphoribosylaminoimidazolecarboxamide formyltransferase/IMP cyclohydrolase [Pseudanabaena sp. PCC 6802]|uniref:bifunctional phosphoribosylaminoimidazolecarboxamide formyltransferase/IMP cyclohydrolase n=1 Tax=Pseudanabaena sp. PCC 6802 TaxID=118173 RepID=UPI000345C2AD|nr:bifunctional phosphoribosylaminoimidazolecarboxamide formyltransferase/IMP cyclohydrolase [Pseudanabaena sp. PCC 6802]
MTESASPKIALISVSDKTGVIDLARSLVETWQFQLISSGGTAKVLKDAGLPVTRVSDYTGAPEILGGRVKTLHPKIHGGILARRDLAADREDLEANGIAAIALVAVNLYPFEQTIARPDVSVDEAIEQIDIGGPAMMRAAAKNHQYITVLSSPNQYDRYLKELADHHGETSLEFRRSLAFAAFQHTQLYDRAIANYLASQTRGCSQLHLAQSYDLKGIDPKPLRYGENPHQNATWYQVGDRSSGWSAAAQLQGKELSYNNLLDLEAARSIVAEFVDDRPCAVIVKHNNPCGVALGDSLVEAYQKAFAADSTSAFGGIVALNRPLDPDTAQAMTATFLECVVAPSCQPEAAAILQAKSNLRVLVLPDLTTGAPETVKSIAGGLLVQQSDDLPVQPDDWKVVTQLQPTVEQMQEMIFAWKICRHVKSNAIAVTANSTTLGIGAGQMNRVGSAQLAISQAGDRARGGILASDGFFPFDDTVRSAAAAGIRAIVQPGGSIRDRDSISAADELGLVMVLTNKRHFLH